MSGLESCLVPRVRFRPLSREVVNARTTESLPLNGRSVLQLVALTPGISTTRSFRNATRSNGNIGAVAFSANGGRNVANMIMLDGSPQEVMGFNQPAYVPTPDAVQEFKVQTKSLAAEYGRTGGAVINIVHRSGTSDFHGVLYEFLRNDKLDANNFFANRRGRDRAPFRFNQFGFTVGGPLTPSRQTTFFFINHEGTRQIQPGNTTHTVPTVTDLTPYLTPSSAFLCTMDLPKLLKKHGTHYYALKGIVRMIQAAGGLREQRDDTS